MLINNIRFYKKILFVSQGWTFVSESQTFVSYLFTTIVSYLFTTIWLQKVKEMCNQANGRKTNVT